MANSNLCHNSSFCCHEGVEKLHNWTLLVEEYFIIDNINE